MPASVLSFVGFAKAPWNKGRLVGQKHPLKPKEVWAICVRLQLEHRRRDLALIADTSISGRRVARELDDVLPVGAAGARALLLLQPEPDSEPPPGGGAIGFSLTKNQKAVTRFCHQPMRYTW